jgi:HEAT repeat protein
VLAPVAIVLVLVAAGARPPSPARADRATVEAKLRGHDGAPGPDAWRTLGAGVDETLAQIAADAKVDVATRARAVSALGYVGTQASRRFLAATVDGKARSTDAGDRLLLRKAAMALGWLGGADVPPRVAPLLQHDDPDVRLDAALALGLTRLPTAAELLRKRLPDEPVARVRAQMGRQLRIVEEALAAAPRPDAGARR